MRFFRWRVWRAIPELDGLSPDRARLFVRAAKRRHGLVTIRWGLPILAFLAGFFALPFAIMGGAALLGASGHTFSNAMTNSTALAVGAPVAVLVLSIAAAWVVRRAVVLRVIRGGLAAGVMPDLLEPIGVTPSLWRSLTRRWRVVAVLILAAVLVIGSPIVWFEWTLARDARLAEADRTGVGPVNALWRSLQPEGSAWDQENAWNFFSVAVQRAAKVDKEVWKHENSPESPSGQPLRPDFVGVGCVYDGQSGYADETDSAAAVKLARELISKYRAAGVFESLASMRSAPRREMTILTQPGATMLDVPWLQGVQSRELARVLQARMVMAEEAGDRTEFIEAQRAILALAGMNSEYPNTIGRLLGNACDARAFIEIRIVLGKHPDKDWLDDIDRALRMDRRRPPLTYTYEAEKLSTLDILAWAFTLKEAIREKRWNAVFGDEKGERRSVGSYTENRAFLSAAFDVMIQNAGKERPNRPAPAVVPSDRFFPSLLLSAIEKSMTSCDQLELERRGITVMLALERYYADHHAYPASLNELVAAGLSSVPIDPWSGRPLGYRLLTAAEGEADPQKRAYFLWSVGGDGVDNGGRLVDRRGTFYAALVTKDHPGYDFIINDFER